MGKTQSKPDPSQAVLDQMLAPLTRIRVIKGGMANGKAIGNTILLDINVPEDIAAFREQLKIIEDPQTFGHCMCLGDPAIELLSGGKVMAVIGFHHGRSIRWDAWQSDAVLTDGMGLVNWMAKRGVRGPQQEVEASRRRQEEAARQIQRWAEAMPISLRPFWDQMMQASFGFATFVPDATGSAPSVPSGESKTNPPSAMMQALEVEFPDPEERVLAILSWFGQGAGPWSGFPAYEQAAETLLLEFPTPFIIDALEHHTLTTDHLEGAARYFAGYHFNRSKSQDRQYITTPLKEKLLAHSLQSPDQDKIKRAQNAFLS
jgi:hypothetical protein